MKEIQPEPVLKKRRWVAPPALREVRAPRPQREVLFHKARRLVDRTIGEVVRGRCVQDVEQSKEAEDEETPLIGCGGKCADETHDDDGEGHKGGEEDVGEGESGGEEDHDDDQRSIDGPLDVADPLNITTNSEYPEKSKRREIFVTYEDISGATREGVPEFGSNGGLTKIRRHSLLRNGAMRILE